jgi:hypothetical protein
MISKSGNATHDATIVSAESTRQAAVNVAGATQATVNTATIAFYRSAVSSAVANGLDAGPFIHALRNLGATV